MVVLKTAAFIGLTGLILWIIGYLLIEETQAGVAVGFIGGVIDLGVGSMITTGGLSYKTGRFVDQHSAGEETISFIYSSVDAPTQLQLGALIMIASFVLIYVLLMKSAESEAGL